MDASHVSLIIAPVSCNIPHPSSLWYSTGKSEHQKCAKENKDTAKNSKVKLKKIVLHCGFLIDNILTSKYVTKDEPNTEKTV